MNAFLLVPMALGILTAIVGINKISPWFTLLVFVGATTTGVVITLTERWKAMAKPSNVVDHAMLSSLQFLPSVSKIKENLRGHDAEVDEIANSIQEELTLSRKGKIIGAYMLVGPTGTGKTFLGLLMAKALYPQSEPLELHLNQMKHPDDVFTLIGAPPGRPGFELGGSLTRPVLQNPYRVVILNEITTCHEDLHHCLYDILDTGQCREKSSGKIVDFSGCVFFATSNIGFEELRGAYAQTDNPGERAGQARDVLNEKGKLDKAFLARWNRVLLMDELEPVYVAEVALLRLCFELKQYGLELTYVSPELLLEAVDRNEEFRSYGVRQIGPFIRQRINRAISEARAAKMTKVHLDVSPQGQFVLKQIG